MTPLVSVICLCYNQDRFVEEALKSVFDQTYDNIQLIVVDDCSTDGSQSAIEKYLSNHSEVPFIRCSVNQGNCRAFNQGLQMATGKYVIDLAGDDVLLNNRVEAGVALLEANPDCGVQFSDSIIVDEKGNVLDLHSNRFPHDSIPSGDIFVALLSRYFIDSPTMMIRKTVLDYLGGYDETLAYEDFDFWVRSSRHFEYIYSPEVLIKRRKVHTSMGTQQYVKGSLQLRSTLTVCEKALELCTSKNEFTALGKRLAYEGRQALAIGAWETAWGYWKLWRKIPK